MARRMREHHETKVAPIAARLISEDPNMHVLTAFTMAQDLASIEHIETRLRDGKPWQRAIWAAGSYGRLTWLKQAIEDGRVPRTEVYAELAELWSGSDPDDTDTFWLVMWKEAFANNGNAPLCDGKRPDGRRDYLTVYRGQPGDAKVGIAWSLDIEVAKRFAITGGGRGGRDDGCVIRAKVNRSRILGFLTGRGEQEVICDPMLLSQREVILRVETEPKREPTPLEQFVASP